MAVKIYNDSRSRKGWVEFDGTLAEAREKVEAKLHDYRWKDCDNCWSTYLLIAVNNKIVEAWVGSYGSWLHSSEPEWEIFSGGISIVTDYEMSLTTLDPRKDYILL